MFRIHCQILWGTQNHYQNDERVHGDGCRQVPDDDTRVLDGDTRVQDDGKQAPDGGTKPHDDEVQDGGKKAQDDEEQVWLGGVQRSLRHLCNKQHLSGHKCPSTH